VKLGLKIFGALSGVLILFLLLGLLLPGTWEAEADTFLPAPPPTVFPFVNRMDQWVDWNPMPESGSEFLGPAEGVGAGLHWDDPQYGEGRVQILTSEADQRVEYEVSVEGGSLRIHGAFSLSPEEGGTRVHWTERGDFGWNPLMGYAARGMSASQGVAMRSSLETLRTLVGGEIFLDSSLLVHPNEILVLLRPVHDREELRHGIRRGNVRQLSPESSAQFQGFSRQEKLLLTGR
jgi:hypothetical protein